MQNVEDFLKNIKPVSEENKSNYITDDDEKTRVEIINYLVNHKAELNYSQRIFDKLENVLADLLKGVN